MLATESKQLGALFHQGQVFAYPTEAVFGLGCDPLNEQAVNRLLELKQRPVEKGLILVADTWERVADYVDIQQLSESQLKDVLATWPGFITWLLPRSDKAPEWITGGSPLIAIRVSAHPVVQAICASVQSTLVSTSANLTGQDAIKNRQQLEQVFQDKVVYIDGELGGAEKPSQIRNALDGQIIRGN
ncbi:Sua5/YciO/YrdC/YwlC family protein [Paraneptunicella aestuarii]|uniref:Sua5/YciO/YrdC/YwlC family protein n=1 Tax=Paraneptunicella aestuarii TaxID=2831148 RepID=UPI001E316DA4|nr:Sua5/YciO/YrdC/YwlC family protein [Paraneptunicella aestuarii]UAA38822.1 Sua5/YciO/YrdC/YwlC family protein [Paraneptunicella aestuarii]